MANRDSDESMLHSLLFGGESTPSHEFHAHTTVNVRAGPSTDHDVIAQLSPGDTVETADESGWASIRLDGQDGYVYLPVLEDTEYREPCNVGDECWWNEAAGTRALSQCRRAVEDLAQYGYEWQHTWTQHRFPRRAYDPDDGVVILMGDNIEMENAFGASRQHVYGCEYDVTAEEVRHAVAEPGTL